MSHCLHTTRQHQVRCWYLEGFHFGPQSLTNGLQLVSICLCFPVIHNYRLLLDSNSARSNERLSFDGLEIKKIIVLYQPFEALQSSARIYRRTVGKHIRERDSTHEVSKISLQNFCACLPSLLIYWIATSVYKISTRHFSFSFLPFCLAKEHRRGHMGL